MPSPIGALSTNCPSTYSPLLLWRSRMNHWPWSKDLGMPPADVCVLNLDLAFEVAADEEGSSARGRSRPGDGPRESCRPKADDVQRC